MSYLSDPLVPYTWEAYLELEAQADTRYEYHDGAILGMAGASNRHNEIATNVNMTLKTASSARGCKAFAMEVKLFRYQSPRYLYPDLMVTCHPLDLQSVNGVRSPLLVIEVLSNSTREADRSFKLREYLKLPTLRHYLLVEQQHGEVQHFRRQAEGLSWEVCFYEYLTDVITIPELDLQLPLTDVYEGITFGPELTQAQEEAEAYGGA